jgi:hypothetical protein
MNGNPTAALRLGRIITGSPPVIDPTHSSFGADHTGVTNATGAIQAAIDAIHASGRPGKVLCAPGQYLVQGLLLRSGVTIDGQGSTFVMADPDAVSASVIDTHVQETTGAISAASEEMTLASLEGVEVGSPLAVRAAGGPSAVQVTTMSDSIADDATSIPLTSSTGWGGASTAGHCWIGDECISFSGVSGGSLQGVQRGLFGTTASAHTSGASIALARRLYATVTEIDGSTVTLDTTAVRGVTTAEVSIGVLRAGVKDLRIDGRKSDPVPSAINPVGITFRLARFSTIRDVAVEKCGFTGIRVMNGTRHCSIRDFRLWDNGAPANNVGFQLILFRGCVGNVATGGIIVGAGRDSVFLDDRTATATEWDAPCEGNIVALNACEDINLNGNYGLGVAGGLSNVLALNTLAGMNSPIGAISDQGIAPQPSRGNVWVGNAARNTNRTAVLTASTTLVQRNVIAANAMEGVTLDVSGNAALIAQSYFGNTNNLGFSDETTGLGSPEGVLSKRPGALYRDRTNGAVYVKVSGTGNTGWQQLALVP